MAPRMSARRDAAVALLVVVATACQSSGSQRTASTISVSARPSVPTATAGTTASATAGPTVTTATTSATPSTDPAAVARWEAMPPAPISGRLGAASAWTGSEVVIAAGVTRNEGRAKAVNDGAAFNPAHGTWRTIAPAPAAGPVLASTWTGRELFALVGDVASERPLRTLFYRPEDDTWREVAGSSPLSFPVGAATWTGDRVVVVAGGPTPAVYTLDPTAGAWRRLETDITLPDNGIVATATGAVVIATGTVDGCAASSNPCAVERHLVMILIDPAAATVRAIDPGPLSVPAVGLPGPAVTAMGHRPRRRARPGRRPDRATSRPRHRNLAAGGPGWLLSFARGRRAHSDLDRRASCRGLLAHAGR